VPGAREKKLMAANGQKQCLISQSIFYFRRKLKEQEKTRDACTQRERDINRGERERETNRQRQKNRDQ